MQPLTFTMQGDYNTPASSMIPMLTEETQTNDMNMDIQQL